MKCPNCKGGKTKVKMWDGAGKHTFRVDCEHCEKGEITDGQVWRCLIDNPETPDLKIYLERKGGNWKMGPHLWDDDVVTPLVRFMGVTQ